MVLVRYLVSGAFNSVFGLAVIMACMAVLGMSPLAANAIGYAAGFALGFFLHRQYTFRSEVGLFHGMAAYLPVVAAAYVANVIVLIGAANWLHMNAYLAQVLGVAVYVAVGFLGSSKYVFNQRKW